MTALAIRCTHCGEQLPPNAAAHIDEHPGLCCDCFDLSVGIGLEALNAERAAKGKPPLKPWKKS